MISKPEVKPIRPYFSSGPCAKFPGWSPQLLSNALVGRSHRSSEALERIQLSVELTKDLLNIPSDYHVGIVPGSATGAMEMALWNLVGEHGVDILSWDVFGQLWVQDLSERLQVKDLRVLEAGVGYLPDLRSVDFSRDVIFTWNGSTSGVCIPNCEWIDDDRQGLTICDATSAIFAYDLEWQKLDVTIFSWQKVLGSEPAHGMIVLSPRAMERLEKYRPSWPVPLLLRLKLRGEINYPFFNGFTLNTPSMLCIEDYILALNWAQSIGGLPKLIERSKNNLAIIEKWLTDQDWIKNTSKSNETKSHTTVCLSISIDEFLFTDANIQWGVIEKVVELLNSERVGFDMKGHRYSNPGFRIWTGPTVESDDIKHFLPWLKWGFFQVYKP